MCPRRPESPTRSLLQVAAQSPFQGVASDREPSDAHLVQASDCSTIGNSSQREHVTDTRADAQREFWQAWLSHRIFGKPSAESRLLLLSDEEPDAATPPNQQSSVAYHLLGDQGEPVARNVGSGIRRARHWVTGLSRRCPDLFAHWQVARNTAP